MRWYARPEGDNHQLKAVPQVDPWGKADDPAEVRQREFLDHAQKLLEPLRPAGDWALRLDVGLPTTRNLLTGGDLDNFAFRLAGRLNDPKLVSVWCTKQHSERSFVRVEAACEMPPAAEFLVATTTGASSESTAYKQQIEAAVARAAELPEGPVRLELAFVVGEGRKWWNLWKPTIDPLGPLLGRDPSGQTPWSPRDGRITELGMHLTVNPAFRYEVEIGIAATAGA